MVREGGLEPPRPKTLEPKSSASANSATRACVSELTAGTAGSTAQVRYRWLVAKTRQQHRIGLIIFVVAAAATCLLLGYWQLSRFESATGTAQNLGYAFQWPAFAAFFIYAYRRFIRLEADREAELADDEAALDDETASAPTADADASPTAKPKSKRVWVDRDKTKMTEIPEYLLPHRTAATRGAESSGDTEPLNEYNDYLARLNARDTEGQRR